MKIRIHIALALAALLFAAAFAPNQALAAKPDCTVDPSHPSCADDGGSDPGNEKLPLHITFADGLAVDDDPAGNADANSDGEPDGYIDDPDGTGVEAFVGSQAKTGDILLRLLNTGGTRWINLTFGGTNDSVDPDCGLPPSGPVNLRHLEVDVQDGAGTPQGVYDLSDDGISEVNVPMRARIEVGVGGQVWVLNYGTGENKLCGASANAHDSVWVIKTPGADQWTAGTFDSNGADAGSLACLEKGGAGKGDKTKFCGRYEMPFSLVATPLP